MSFERDARDHRREGTRLESAAALAIVRAYAGSIGRVRREFARVEAFLLELWRAGKRPSRSALTRREDLGRAVEMLEASSREFAMSSRATVERTTRTATVRGMESGWALVRSGSERLGVEARLFVPPVEAATILSENLSADRPLGRLFAELAPQAAVAAKEAILTGALSGENPRAIARELDRVLEVPRWRALTISRTEVLRSFRTASLASYRASGVVDGWEWLSALDSRTCVVCWAMHGTVHPNSEEFASHPNCRCSPIPIVGGERLLEPGADVFARLPEARQLETLGPKAFEAYKEGRLDLRDLVRTGRHPAWGPFRARRPLSEALGSSGAGRKVFALGQTEGGEAFAVRDRPDLAGLTETEFVEAIRNEPNEVLTAFRDGRQIHVPVQGSRNRVPLTPGVDYRGATVVHNHPDDLPPSRQDVMHASRLRFAELRVVTPKRSFLLQPDVAWPDKDALSEVFLQAHHMAESATRRDVDRLKNPPGDEWARRRYRTRYVANLARLLKHNGVILRIEV